MSQIKSIENSVILITGGTGSFGNTLTEILLKNNVKEIRIFSRDENKQDLMRKKINDTRVSFYIGNVRDLQSTSDACVNVDYIFHAAALKQVPSCEFFPLEAFKTNVLGTENILKASLDRDVKKVVLLSTDKAVYPINAMGLSKGMMEKLMLSKSLHNYEKGIFCATRYGNVICSRGSVIPLFVDQIKKNKPITITDPNMTRYLMSLEDAVSLVLYAFDEGLNGDIFVQKAPACTIGDLVLALKEIFNYKKDNIIIGTRHSEKLYETLISREEMARVEDRDKFFKIPPDNRGLDYDNYFIKGNEILSSTLDYTSHNTRRLKVNEIIETLLKTDFISQFLK
tara:strand:- start:208 stop:1227 length:1020 start_codon:yes stop_codon:yes gene_type:complete